MEHTAAVTNVTTMMRRRAANALLNSASALARMADELADLEASGQSTTWGRDRYEALQRDAAALREEYHEALFRYRAVMGANRAG